MQKLAHVSSLGLDLNYHKRYFVVGDYGEAGEIKSAPDSRFSCASESAASWHWTRLRFPFDHHSLIWFSHD